MTDLNPVDAMTTDYRAICAELVRRWDTAPCWPSPSQRHDLLDIADAMNRARALLAQPVAEGPTDEDLDEFALFWWGSDTDQRTVTDVIECCSMAAYARAVLTKWGANAQ
jgi:nucleoside-diphosphate-sugar epimerase